MITKEGKAELIEKIERLKKTIERCKNVLILVQKSNDTDTICSAIALNNLLSDFYKRTYIGNISLSNSRLIDNLETVYNVCTKEHAEDLDHDNTIVFLVDINSPKQIEGGTEIVKKCMGRVRIDHHTEEESDEFSWEFELEIIEPGFTSCCEVILEMSKHINGITKETAEKLFGGLYTDSVNFTGSRVNFYTFKHAAELCCYGIDPSSLIKKLEHNDIKHCKIIAEVIKTAEVYGELVVLNLTPQIVYQYYPSNFKTERYKRIAQKKLITNPLKVCQRMIRCKVIAFVHYSLYNSFNTDRKFVFFLLQQPNKELEELLLKNGFDKQRDRFSKGMKFGEFTKFISDNLELLSK